MRLVHAGEVEVIAARHVDRVARAESYDWVDLVEAGVRLAKHDGQLHPRLWEMTSWHRREQRPAFTSTPSRDDEHGRPRS